MVRPYLDHLEKHRRRRKQLYVTVLAIDFGTRNVHRYGALAGAAW